MRRNRKRLALALCCSLACYGGTLWIYRATAPHSLVGGAEPIAFVTRIDNEVERRLIKRTLWQDLENGDPVYPGEAIRTSKNGEAKLIFQGSTKTLEVEADSMILLSKNSDEISLELLDGSVFVAQGENDSENENKLTLKSEAGQIDLSKATVALSKEENKSVDMQVLKGSATFKNGSETRSIKQGQVSSLGANASAKSRETLSIKTLSPKNDAPVFVSAQNPAPLRFAWDSGPVPGKSEVWFGTSRKELKIIGANPTLETSSLQHSVRPGRYFWKVVTKDAAGKTVLGESPVQRLEVKALASPPIVQPQKGEFITLQSEGMPVRFEWSSPDRVSEITLEIASNESFRKPIFSEKMKPEIHHLDRILPTGKYFWRVSAYYPDEKEVISSQPQGFEIWVKPPKVINITWSIGKTMFYPIEPVAELKWDATEDPDIKKWRIKINAANDQSPQHKALEFEVSEKKLVTPLPSPGRWIASVEALDQKGNTLSKSENRGFDLAVLPLIPAPLLLPEVGDLKASNRGDIELKWRGPAGAKNYTLNVKNAAGKSVTNRKLTSTSMALTDLMPGRYQVEVGATDEYGRTSEPAPPRRLLVPDNSGLSAPKMKRIEVK